MRKHAEAAARDVRLRQLGSAAAEEESPQFVGRGSGHVFLHQGLNEGIEKKVKEKDCYCFVRCWIRLFVVVVSFVAGVVVFRILSRGTGWCSPLGLR